MSEQTEQRLKQLQNFVRWERDNRTDVPPVGRHIVDWAVREIELMHEENSNLRKKNRYLRRKNCILRKKLQSLKKISTEADLK